MWFIERVGGGAKLVSSNGEKLEEKSTNGPYSGGAAKTPENEPRGLWKPP